MYIYLFHLDLILRRSHPFHPCKSIKSLFLLFLPRRRETIQATPRAADAHPLCSIAVTLCLTLSLWLAVPSLTTAVTIAAPLFIADSPPQEQSQSLTEPIEGDRALPRGSADISSETLNRFVTAYRQVLTLVEERADELRRAETESKSLRIQRDLENEAIATIEKTGLTWQEYVQLLSLANSDVELSERIVIQLQELAPSNEKDF